MLQALEKLYHWLGFGMGLAIIVLLEKPTPKVLWAVRLLALGLGAGSAAALLCGCL